MPPVTSSSKSIEKRNHSVDDNYMPAHSSAPTRQEGERPTNKEERMNEVSVQVFPNGVSHSEAHVPAGDWMVADDFLVFVYGRDLDAVCDAKEKIELANREVAIVMATNAEEHLLFTGPAGAFIE